LNQSDLDELIATQLQTPNKPILYSLKDLASNPLFASPSQQPDPGGFVSAQIENEATFAEISREIGEEVLHLTPKPSPSKPSPPPNKSSNPPSRHFFQLLRVVGPMKPDIFFPK
jgi:hypothetical protein